MENDKVWIRIRGRNYSNSHFEISSDVECKFQYLLFRDAANFSDLPLRQIKDIPKEDFGCQVCIHSFDIPEEFRDNFARVYGGDWIIVEPIRPPVEAEIVVKVRYFSHTVANINPIKRELNNLISHRNLPNDYILDVKIQ